MNVRYERLKYHIDLNRHTLSENIPEDWEFQYIDIGNVNSSGTILEKQRMRFGEAPTRARRKVAKGDTIVSTVRTYLKAITYIDSDEDDMVCSTGFAVLTPKKTLHPKFLAYYSRSTNFIDEVVARSVGVSYPAVNASDIADIKVPILPFNVQQSIASYLDQQTAKLDQLVEKKQRLIDLLQEKRQALITHAVTKGLDPNVPMKDSGIEWLGEVPAHWTVSRLKPFIILNPSKQEISKFSLDTEVTFVPMEAVNESGIIDYSRIKIISDCVAGYTYFRDGDVLLAKITPCFENGKAALVNGLNNGIGFGSTEFHVLRANSNTDRHYLVYIVQSDPFRKLGEASMIGAAGQKRVPESFILNFKQAYPPIDEQIEIAKFLDREISNIDKIINKLNQQITTIKEYRQALITAAVTGQIDVREKLAVSAEPIPAGKE
jgi:restriction endonuclease S subunit